MKMQILSLIKELKNSVDPLTSVELSNRIGVSSRTIKNYIQEINSIRLNAITSSQKGYVIDKMIAQEFLDSSQNTIPQTSPERVTFIINQIIQRGSINIFDLCDEMYISYSTLRGELKKVKKRLQDANLDLSSTNNQLEIKGLEKNKRKLLSSIMYSESKNGFIGYENMTAVMNADDIQFIKSTIMESFRLFRYFINDYSLENLILHIVITIDRIKNGYINENNEYTRYIPLHEYELSKQIIEKLENHFDIQFNKNELTEFTLLILSRASNLNYKEITDENIVDYIGADIYSLTKDIIEEFELYFYINLSETQFFVRFALHIKNVMIRANSGYFSKNPLTESIKQNCPLIYDAAANAARLIYRKKQIYLNDDEIAYIAFHIGGAVELQNTITTKITVCAYCPNYYDLNTSFTEKVNSRFHEQIILTDVITDEKLLSSVHTDIILCTLETHIRTQSLILTVSPFLSESDCTNIEQTISELKKRKRRQLFKDNLQLLVKPELFKVQDFIKDKETAIHEMTLKLETLGYVDSTFEKEVIERDYISSTAFGAFAIPHALQMSALKTGMNIMILQNPLVWDNTNVQLIIMLAFNKNDRYIFNEIFEPLTMILTNHENLSKLIKVSTHEDFINYLASCIE